MLAVYGLRREEMGGLDATRLVDGYIRRQAWLARLQAVEVGRVFAPNPAPKTARPFPKGKGQGPGKYERVGSGELLRMAGVKL